MFKKHIKLLVLLSLLLVCIASLCSCFDIDEILVDLGVYEKNSKVNESFTVILRETAGVTIEGEDDENVKNIKSGGTAKFKISISESYIYLGNTAGAIYDAEKGELTLKKVNAPTTIDIILVAKSELYSVEVVKTEPRGIVEYVSGTIFSVEPQEVVLKATVPDGYIFIGWSKGGALDDGGELISRELQISYTPKESEKNTVIYANFENASKYTIVYDPNGGTTNSREENYTVNGEYSSYFLLQQTLHEDNDVAIFDKNGYIPIGYSTEPTSEYAQYSSVNEITGFSNLGGVCEVPKDTGKLTLYVVWARVSADSEFNYTTSTYSDIWANPDNSNNAKDCVKQPKTGIVITSYKGSSETVVIPEKINGKEVIGVATNAFTSKNVKKIVIPKTVVKIEDRAFNQATALKEVVFFDSLQYVSDTSFPSTLSTIVMSSQKLPAFSGTGAEGSFCIKYERVRALRNSKKIVVVSGSSTLNGLNSKMLYEGFNGEYEVINYGTNAGTQMLFYLDVISNYVTEGDLIIHAPEFTSGAALGDNNIHWKLFRGNNQCYDIFREVDMSKYTGFWSAYQTSSIGTLLGINDTNWTSLNPGKPYQHTNIGMNFCGDLLGNRNARTSFDRASYNIHTSLMNSTRATALNKVNSVIVSKGGRMLLSFGTIDALSMSDTSWKTKADEVTRSFANLLNYPVISNIGTYIMGEKDDSVAAAYDQMYNSPAHCTYYGANIRTIELTYDIKKYLAGSATSDSWQNYTTRESQRSKNYPTYSPSDWYQ